MAGSVTKPVWTWTGHDCEPVRCGTFSWRDGLGEFQYDPEFMRRPNATPLDPVRLRFNRSTRPLRETLQRGIFGVLRDAMPEGYGLGLLESAEGRELDPVERMEMSAGDGVGAIEVCEDIGRKLAFSPIPLEHLLKILAEIPEAAPPSRAVREAHGIAGTTLGGERPKMTVSRESGELWIAKLQDRGDAANTPLREYLAMKSAQACGVAAAEVEFKRAGPHQVMLVRRFDRHLSQDGRVARRGFASAHTVLGLDSSATRGDPKRSYPFLAAELQRWCAGDGSDLTPQRRELWRRMAFNTICGNGDDHPRNHGLLCVDGHWGLAPAYDIAPYITFSGTLAMSITRDGLSDATRWALLRDCDTFGVDREEAMHFIDQSIATMTETWSSTRRALGFSDSDAPTPEPERWLNAEPPPGLPARRASRSRR